MKKHLFLSLLLLLLLLLGFQQKMCSADTLSNKEAIQILNDTYLIVGYLGLKGEPSYKNPANIIKAALFGAFDARANFDYKQDIAKENGKKILPETTPLFQIHNQIVMAKEVLLREKNKSIFAGLPEEYNVFVSRSACELAALRFTGHRIKEHMRPDEYTKLTEKGYFFSIEGLGDLLSEAKLKKIQETKTGYTLSGIIEDEQEESAKKRTFTLELTKGDVPGTWLRTFKEK